jgi:hypothetical protein
MLEISDTKRYEEGHAKDYEDAKRVPQIKPLHDSTSINQWICGISDE